MNLGLEASKGIWQATLGYLYGVSELGCGFVEPKLEVSIGMSNLSLDGLVEQTRVQDGERERTSSQVD